MEGVITLGEALIDFTPLDRENLKFKKNPGGAPANVAVGLSRLGAKVSFIGKVGNDLLGRFLRETLQEEQVNVENMLLTEQARTGLTFVTLDETGDRSFSFYIDPSADRFLRKEEINEELISQHRILHVGSISLIDEPARTATEYAVEAAQKHGLLISYDPNLRLGLWDTAQLAKERITSLLPEVDILKVAVEELEFITGVGKIERAVELISQQYSLPLIFITAGSQGAYYYYQNELGFLPARQVEAVDTTGAGDAFMSGVLYNLAREGKLSNLEQEYLDYITEFANLSASLAVSAKGAMSALPSLKSIEALLDEKA